MMRLKLICLTCSLLMSFNQLQAQSFNLLGIDPSSDCTCTCMDAFEIYYAYDIPQDSVWFLMIPHYAIPIDYGFYLAIDMDDTVSNGDSWTGASSGPCMGLMDFNMNHDRVITAWPTFSFIEAFDAGGGTIVTSDVNTLALDATTMKISTKLSYIDANMDGTIKLIGGFGQDSYRIHDVMPDAGFYTTGNSGLAESTIDFMFNISPNPVNEMVTIRLNEPSMVIQELYIYDIYGRIVKVPDADLSNEASINTASFSNGIYFVSIKSQNKIYTKKFIK